MAEPLGRILSLSRLAVPGGLVYGQSLLRLTSLTTGVAGVLLALAVAPAASGADRAYWANGNNTISYANLDGSGGGGQLNISGATANGARGVAVDPVAGRIYWGNQGNNTISYANLDGSGGGGQLNVTGSTITAPHGVVIDPSTRRIYWADEDPAHPIQYAGLDGSGGGHLDTTGATHADPYGLAIDPLENKIYWANRDTNTISYAKLDGTGGGGELNHAGAPMSKPHGVAIDPASRRVFWSNLGNTIGYANLDGSGGGSHNLAGGGAGGPLGIAVDPTAGRIWWANLGNDQISFAALDGSGGGGQISLAGATSNDPRFLALVRAPQPIGGSAISGGSAIGSVLSCSQPAWEQDVPGAFLYREPQAVGVQWSRDGTDIAGATTGLYTAFAAGAYRCRTTATSRGGSTSVTSAAHTIAAPSIPSTGGGGGTGGGAPVLAGAPVLPPAPASFAGSKSVIAVDRDGSFVFTFRGGDALAGRADFDFVGRVRVSRRSKGRRRVPLARRPFTVLPGGQVTLEIQLSRESLRILTLNRRLATRVTVVVRNAAGLTSTATRRITLEAPQLRKR